MIDISEGTQLDSTLNNTTVGFTANQGPLTDVFKTDSTSVGVSTRLVEDVLFITGTNGNDHFNGLELLNVYDIDQVKRVEVRALGGHDILDFRNVSTDVWMYGGEGNDILLGGKGRDLIVGMAGTDVLRGYENDDILYGGQGQAAGGSVTPSDGLSLIEGGIGSDLISLGVGIEPAGLMPEDVAIESLETKAGLRKFADGLWDNGATPEEIGQQMKGLSVGLDGIADATYNGITDKSGFALNDPFTTAKALWHSGYGKADGLDARKLADLLWDKRSSAYIVGAALNELGITVEGIADAVKEGITKSDGSGLGYDEVITAILGSGYGSVDGVNPARKLADLIFDEGATPRKIGQILKSFDFGLEAIADAIDDGLTLPNGTKPNYFYTADALWYSGHDINPRQLADLLWDEGLTPGEVGDSLRYVGISFEEMADAIAQGITTADGSKLNYPDVALALWESSSTMTARKLADLLWDQGIGTEKIGQAMGELGFSLEDIADAVYDGITRKDGTPLKNFFNVTQALWNSGYDLNARQLSVLLWNEGALLSQIVSAIKYVGGSVEVVADALDDGLRQGPAPGVDYKFIAYALSNSQYSISAQKLADVLWDEGASAKEIGRALKFVGHNLGTILDAVKNGVTTENGRLLNHLDVTDALLNSGHSIDARRLANALAYQSSSSKQAFSALKIGQSLKHAGYSIEQTADAMTYLTRIYSRHFNHTHVAKVLWESGYSRKEIDARKLADLLWDNGFSEERIGQAMAYVGISESDIDKRVIADAIANGITNSDGSKKLDYISVTKALWNQGSGQYGVRNSKYSIGLGNLADILWDEGANSAQIGQALKYAGASLDQIADAVKNQITNDGGSALNYLNVAEALRNSGHKITIRQLADLLWDEGATPQEIGQAMRVVECSLGNIADAMANGITLENGSLLRDSSSVSLALWNSGLATSARNVAGLLKSTKKFSPTEIGWALRDIGISKEGIGDAMAANKFSWNEVAEALWNTGLVSTSSPKELAGLLLREGADFIETRNALRYVLKLDLDSAYYYATTSALAELFNDISDSARSSWEKAETLYEDNKSTIAVVAPGFIQVVETSKTIAQSIESGDIEVIVDGLKTIPVASSVVWAIETAAAIYYRGHDKDRAIFEASINAALLAAGASALINPEAVKLIVGIVWPLRGGFSSDAVQQATTNTLNKLGLEEETADLFVDVVWSLNQGNVKSGINTALTQIGFEYGQEFIDVAWGIVEDNYESVLNTGIELVGLDKLSIDQAKATAFINVAVAINNEDYNKAVDVLATLAGGDTQAILQSQWAQDLRDGNPTNDRGALQQGLSELGYNNAAQWNDIAWDVKEGDYLDALSSVLKLADFEDAQAWVEIIEAFRQKDYLNGLSKAFTLAGFEDGQELAEAAIEIQQGDFLGAFYESFDLIEGGSDLKEAIKAIQKFDIGNFIDSMIEALPLLRRLGLIPV